MSFWTDDREEQDTLDIGLDAGVTADRDGVTVTGSEEFADDRDHDRGDDPGEQAGLFSEVTDLDDQMTLGGDQAQDVDEGFFGSFDSGDGGNGGLDAGPLLSHDERALGMGQVDDDPNVPTFPEAAAFDVSLSPDEAFGGVGTGSREERDPFNFSIPDPNGDALIAEDLAEQRQDVEFGRMMDEADRAGVLSADPNGDAAYAPDDLFAEEGDEIGETAREIKMITLDNASTFRERHEEWLHETDHRGRKAVQVDPNAPDHVIEQAEAMRDDMGAEAARSHTANLTEDERERISESDGFTRRATVANWRSAKGVFEREGLGDQFWDAIPALADHDDPLEGAEQWVDRHRGRMAEAGVGGIGAFDEGEQDIVQRQRAGRAAQRELGEREGHAIAGAKEGHEEAIQALIHEAGWEPSEARALAGRVDDPADSMTEDRFERIVEVEIVRARSNGRFVRDPPEPVPGQDNFRAPTTGRFKGSEFDEEHGIGRDPQTGHFVGRDS